MTTTWLTYEQACEHLSVPRKTMDAWRRTHRGPSFRKLPNGKLRITLSDLESWAESLAVA